MYNTFRTKIKKPPVETQQSLTFKIMSSNINSNSNSNNDSSGIHDTTRSNDRRKAKPLRGERTSRNSLPKGINQHAYTPKHLSEMLSTSTTPPRSQRHIETRYQPRNRSQYQQKRAQQPQEEESGILGWLHSQQRKRQKEALEKAVEEQRRILLQETRRLENKYDKNNDNDNHSSNNNSTSNKSSNNNNNNNIKGLYITKDRQLTDNPTFKSMTNQHPHQSVAEKVLTGLPLCYMSNDSDDDDEEYIVDANTGTTGNVAFHGGGDEVGDGDRDGRERITSTTGEAHDEMTVLSNQQETSEHPSEETEAYSNSVEYQSAMTAQSRSNHTSISTEMYSCTAGSQDEDTIRFRTPCATDTGGLMVQLEFLEKENAEQQHFERDPEDLVKVFDERGCTEDIPFLLTLEQMTAIAENGLPPSMMFSRWKRIYSLQRDGDSFDSAFLKKVHGHERTLLVVQTTKGEVMGAFSNSAWKGHGPSASAHFYGSAQASLFAIDKETGEVLVYKWTGKNTYIQVCDMQHKLIALGGGGKDGEFGLCIEDDFRIGSTGPCETFGNARLCTQDQFEIMNVECWGFISGFC